VSKTVNKKFRNFEIKVLSGALRSLTNKSQRMSKKLQWVYAITTQSVSPY
jgi:hypothetical protein